MSKDAQRFAVTTRIERMINERADQFLVGIMHRKNASTETRLKVRELIARWHDHDAGPLRIRRLVDRNEALEIEVASLREKLGEMI